MNRLQIVVGIAGPHALKTLETKRCHTRARERRFAWLLPVALLFGVAVEAPAQAVQKQEADTSNSPRWVQLNDSLYIATTTADSLGYPAAVTVTYEADSTITAGITEFDCDRWMFRWGWSETLTLDRKTVLSRDADVTAWSDIHNGTMAYQIARVVCRRS